MHLVFTWTFSPERSVVALRQQHYMTQTIVLYRLMGTVEVTFNQLAVVEVDEPQLCQGLEALEVACSRRARVRGCQSQRTFQEHSNCCLGASMTDDKPNHCFVSTRGND